MVKNIQLGARVLLGLIYFVFGLMGLAVTLGLMKMPEPVMPEAAMAFTNGMASSGYFMPLLKVTEALGGLCLLTGIAAPAALVILAPITLHIFLFHAFLTPGVNNSILPLVMIVLQAVAMLAYKDRYRPLFRKK